MAVPTTTDPKHPDRIRAGCLLCQAEFTMFLKSGYYEGRCSCGQVWQTPKDPRNAKLHLKKEF